jgi:hypothetical protein
MRPSRASWRWTAEKIPLSVRAGKDAREPSLDLPPSHLALVPRLGLVIVAAERQQVAPETRAALLWTSSAALAVLVGLAEVYIGSAVVRRRHAA